MQTSKNTIDLQTGRRGRYSKTKDNGKVYLTEGGRGQGT
jgi:hypothetical protein